MSQTFGDLSKGVRISNTLLAAYIGNDVTKYGNQWIGDYIRYQNGEQVEDISHLEQAPDGTLITIRDFYKGRVHATKANNRWYVT